MRTPLFLSFVTLICMLVLTACDKKQHAIDNLSSFVEKVEKHASEYNEEDWAEVNKEYEEINAEIDKYDYSGDESKRIATLKGKFTGIKAKYKVSKFIDDIDKAVQEVKGTIKGITEGIIGNSNDQDKE